MINSKALPPRTIAVLAQRPSDYVEMRRCASALHSLGWTMQIIYICQAPDSPEEKLVIADIGQKKLEGVFSAVVFFGLSEYSSQKKKESQVKRSTFHNVGLWLNAHFPKSMSIVDRIVQYFYSLIWYCSALIFHPADYIRSSSRFDAALKALKPDALILPEDVVGPITPLLIKAGHKHGISSVILPYTIANQEEAFRSLADHPSYQLSRLPNRIVGALFPIWVMRRGDKAVLRLPGSYVIGQALTRTVPPDPWMMNSGFADVIAVENPRMKEYYRKSGIPESRMQVTGTISDDHLAHYLLNKEGELEIVRAELNIQNQKPLLVVGGCPDQSTSCPPGFEFADMADFVDHLAKALLPLSQQYEIIVRSHPNYVSFGAQMESLGIRSTMMDTARLIALSDLYIAFASATIRWAIACQVPVVNYDVFHYKYDDYRDVPGVVEVREYAAFNDLVPNLSPDQKLYQSLKDAVRQECKDWGCLDGQSTLRIAQLVNRLCRSADGRDKMV